MKSNIRKTLEEDFKESMIVIDKMFYTLHNDNETKLIIEKLENMDPQFLYNSFSEVFTGFKTIHETKNTLSILINSLLDDSELYIETYIYNQKTIDDIKKYNSSFVIEPIYDVRITDEVTETPLTSKTMIEFINSKEKKEVKNINDTFKMCSENSVETGLKSIECFKKYVDNFSPENLKDLDDRIKKYFEVK